MSKFFLITTPILETWDFEKDTLMLGSWCKPFDKKEKNKDLKSCLLLDYHWEDSKKVYKDYLYLNNFGEKVLSNLFRTLNTLHNVPGPAYMRIAKKGEPSNWASQGIFHFISRFL